MHGSELLDVSRYSGWLAVLLWLGMLVVKSSDQRSPFPWKRVGQKHDFAGSLNCVHRSSRLPDDNGNSDAGLRCFGSAAARLDFTRFATSMSLLSGKMSYTPGGLQPRFDLYYPSKMPGEYRISFL